MKYLDFTQPQKDAICKDFTEQMMKCKTIPEAKALLAKMNISDEVAIPSGQKPLVIFSSKAYIKILELVEQCKEEIGWHGLVVKAKDKQIYLVKDIIMFPQHVTGGSVIPDTEAYAKWTVEQMKDPVHFQKIRYHGHSHVNMGVFSSGVDNGYQNHILSQLPQDDFYIFTIHNKRNDLAIRIYDTTKNVMYEDKDIEIRIYHEQEDLNVWAAEKIKEFVRTGTNPVTPITNYQTTMGSEQTKSYPPANPLKKKGGRHGSK